VGCGETLQNFTLYETQPGRIEHGVSSLPRAMCDNWYAMQVPKHFWGRLLYLVVLPMLVAVAVICFTMKRRLFP
jgi:hypothetical protein